MWTSNDSYCQRYGLASIPMSGVFSVGGRTSRRPMRMMTMLRMAEIPKVTFSPLSQGIRKDSRAAVESSALFHLPSKVAKAYFSVQPSWKAPKPCKMTRKKKITLNNKKLNNFFLVFYPLSASQITPSWLLRLWNYASWSSFDGSCLDGIENTVSTCYSISCSLDESKHSWPVRLGIPYCLPGFPYPDRSLLRIIRTTIVTDFFPRPFVNRL